MSSAAARLLAPRLAQWRLACTGARQGAAGALLLALLALPFMRALLESSMWRHMVLQFPLWMLAGALLAAALPPRARAALARCNAHGISGLVGVAVVLAVLMVPRVLDLALRSPAAEALKCLALVLAGAALRLSWHAAGRVVQGFFLGNVLPMSFVVGQLYVDSPLRLCNAYLLDDQERLGRWLMALAAAVAVAWVSRVFWVLARREPYGAP
ncbi:hypothetical protein [Pulveribacter suum]|uniref:Uncharacterized protein n=1 Tax=Pulveribacter suum TaxID=2116657 RepID=A0A2P1NJG4_9BURK|nr:hypothetical protein [Pulveribacter suum]AVP57219.1 hypothetical protein C7H73_05755 [Pulveribacter suum]